MLNGQPVAIRTGTGSTSSLDYLHGDQLGSMGLSTNAKSTGGTPWQPTVSDVAQMLAEQAQPGKQ